MADRIKTQEFEWDHWNLDKSFKKHGITPKESEEIFLDENLKVTTDVRHAQKESRYIAFGKTFTGRTLFVVFTMRGNKIRVISARPANRREKKVYEKEIKENTPL